MFTCPVASFLVTRVMMLDFPIGLSHSHWRENLHTPSGTTNSSLSWTFLSFAPSWYSNACVACDLFRTSITFGTNLHIRLTSLLCWSRLFSSVSQPVQGPSSDPCALTRKNKRQVLESRESQQQRKSPPDLFKLTHQLHVSLDQPRDNQITTSRMIQGRHLWKQTASMLYQCEGHSRHVEDSLFLSLVNCFDLLPSPFFYASRCCCHTMFSRHAGDPGISESQDVGRHMPRRTRQYSRCELCFGSSPCLHVRLATHISESRVDW